MKDLIIGISLFVIIPTIVGCSLFEEESNKGSLVIILQFAEAPEVSTSNKKLTTSPQIEIDPIDRAHCQVIRYGSTVWEDDLDLLGSYYQAYINLDAGGGYEVYVECFIDNQLAYDGHESGIHIDGGETTTVNMFLNITTPSAPSNLEADPVSSTQIELNWDDNSVNETGFIIQLSMEDTNSFGTIDSRGENIETFLSGWLIPSTDYYYRVCAYNSAGNSPYSNVVMETTLQPPAGYEQDFPSGTTGQNITMVWIPPGSFMQGAYSGEDGASSDEYPQHLVTINYSFWMGKYEVTQAQWEAVIDSNWSFNFDDNPDHPAEYVSWNDITNTFLPLLNSQTIGSPWRLPSESEWEYACRAGTTTRFYWGDDPSYSLLGNYAWYNGNSGSTTHTVETKQPNAWGLYDMSGNVWEWCEDYWHDDYIGAPDDGSEWLIPAHSYHILRGGSWDNYGEFCRSAKRHLNGAGAVNYSVGFRLIRNP